MTLPDKLVLLRKKNGLTQLDIADRLGVSRQAISRWEVGSAVPNIDNLKTLSSLYHVTIDQLLDDRSEACPETQNAPPSQQTHSSVSGTQSISLTVLAIVFAVSILLLAGLWFGRPQNKDISVPISELESMSEDSYPVSTFTIQ